MLTKQDKDRFRGMIFSNLDELVTASTALVIHNAGLAPVDKYSKGFPHNELATVSIKFLKGTN